MKVVTLNFGELDISQEELIIFNQGLPGFEDLKKFVLIQPDPNVPFSYLQSVEQGEFSMIVTSPFLFYPEYDLELSEQVQKELQIEQENDVVIWSTITIKEKIETATINLLAPIVVNTNKKCGKQIILNDSNYRTKHKLIQTEKHEVK